MSSQPVDRPSLEDFERFCKLLRVEDGSQLQLHDFQKRFLKDYFAGTRETLVLLPKKNGKSTIIAALALYHLLVVRDAECVIAAASRDQATIILGQARKFIRWSPELQRRVKMNQRQINHFHTEGRIRVLASDEDTADGVIPTLAIVDELHRHKSSALYGVFRDGLGPRRGQMITISTAGDDEESPLGLMRGKAYQLSLRREGAYRFASSPDGGYALHEWALEPDQDRDDLELVKEANPAPWQTVEALRARLESPSMTPWSWARFACGVWLQGEDRAIGPVEWGMCASEPEQPTGEVRLGLDLGWKVDCTAIVPHWMDEQGVAHLGLPEILARLKTQGIPLSRGLRSPALRPARCPLWRPLLVSAAAGRVDRNVSGTQERRSSGVAQTATGERAAAWRTATPPFSDSVTQGGLGRRLDGVGAAAVRTGQVAPASGGRPPQSRDPPLLPAKRRPIAHPGAVGARPAERLARPMPVHDRAALAQHEPAGGAACRLGHER